ncbi:hypothetical protein EYB33_18965 [Lysinibacillus sphaericus]|uniref:hypothetical protein n=1 Tax=Lysinibacillus sphaericus TaxID=1421 RepID=UPI001E538E80|nr:hypothetical protein [Lysinibacillus sphaericus]UDK98224.1 hypothetical protein EYB33_18965 [Lysinibacillus sphaericus]
MVQFGVSERHIVSLFTPGSRFSFNGKEYEVKLSGKPTTRQGEPKTDIYVRCVELSGNDLIEFKISFKQENADFLENKMTAQRAEQIFGPGWQEIISGFTKQIEQQFLLRPYIYKNKFKRTGAGCITLGWKFELLNKSGGELSDKVKFSPSEVVEVYAGRKLDDSKRNATVNGIIIPESGVANCVINCDIHRINTIQEAVDNIIPIEEFARLNPDVYFACKALNYRTFEDKYDGNRPLSVFIDWQVINNKLTPKIIYHNPLLIRGNQVADKLKESLHRLGIRDTNDINPSNVSTIDFIH